MQSRYSSLKSSCALLALVVFASACSTFGTLGGSASPVIDRIRDRGEIRIGMMGDYPPLNLLDNEDRNVGLEPDLAEALAATLGVKLVVVNKPFSELLPTLESGAIDAVMSGMTMTPARNMDVAFAGPYFISGKALLTRSATVAGFDAPAELNSPEFKLTVLAGTTSQTFAANAMPKANIIPAESYEAAVAMVIDGSANAMLADYPACVTALMRNPGQGLLSLVAPFTFEPIGIALPANDTLFVNLVENYLKSLEGTGLLTKLREKWFEDSGWLENAAAGAGDLY
jgi:polar amino acid transport system substrate-binding protein